jgi:filamentous hemagglutinin
VALDALKSDPIGTAKDAAKVATGAMSTFAGGALCSTAAGCVPGSMMAALGTNDMTEGATALANRFTGQPGPGYNPLRTMFTDSYPTPGGTIYDGLNLASALLALNAQVPLKLGVADGLNRPTSMFGVTVPAYSNIKLAPIVNLPVSGANQALMLYGVGSKANTVANDIKGGNR